MSSCMWALIDLVMDEDEKAEFLRKAKEQKELDAVEDSREEVLSQ